MPQSYGSVASGRCASFVTGACRIGGKTKIQVQRISNERKIVNSLMETRFVTRSRLVRTYLESLCRITPKSDKWPFQIWGGFCYRL